MAVECQWCKLWCLLALPMDEAAAVLLPKIVTVAVTVALEALVQALATQVIRVVIPHPLVVPLAATVRVEQRLAARAPQGTT